MPITTTIDHVRGMIVTTMGMTVTDHDWVWLQATLRSLVDSGLAFDQIVDLRPVEDCRLSPNVMSLSAKNPAVVSGSRQALVAVDNLTYGMCRMYEILAASRSLNIEVFRDIRAAREWLAPAEAPQPLVARNDPAAQPGGVGIRSLPREV